MRGTPKKCPKPSSPKECACNAQEEKFDDPPVTGDVFEKPEWVKDRGEVNPYDKTQIGFVPIPNFRASAIEISILENKITRPDLTPLKCPQSNSRAAAYDRKFYARSGIAEALDVCFMAWSQIREPSDWSQGTYRALFDAVREYAYDSMLAAEDSTVCGMTDKLLSDFVLENYTFHLVFAPLHCGTLFADRDDTTNWNLASSLEMVFASDVFTGAVVICGKAHFGAMRKNGHYYAWWPVSHSKDFRVTVSEDFEDYLRLLVKHVNETRQTEFYMRIVTVSYAKIVGPDRGELHEPLRPSTSLPEIYRRWVKRKLTSSIVTAPIKEHLSSQ